MVVSNSSSAFLLCSLSWERFSALNPEFIAIVYNTVGTKLNDIVSIVFTLCVLLYNTLHVTSWDAHNGLHWRTTGAIFYGEMYRSFICRDTNIVTITTCIPAISTFWFWPIFSQQSFVITTYLPSWFHSWGRWPCTLSHPPSCWTGWCLGSH